jgi:hypothetical protein
MYSYVIVRLAVRLSMVNETPWKCEQICALTDVCILVCMYVCIGVGHKTSPCTASFNDLLCFPFQLALY